MTTQKKFSIGAWALSLIISLNLSAQNTSIVRQASAEFPDIKTVKVDGQFSKIEIAPSEDNKVYFSGKLSSDKQDEAYQLLNEATGNVLNIAIKFPAQGWTTHSGEVLLKIPQGTVLDINTTSGTIKMEKIQDANVKIVTRSGNIDVTNCNGNISLESITSAIKFTNCTGTLSAKSKSGNQFLNTLKGKISANSTEGEITISQTEGNIITESTTGNQSIGFHNGNVTGKSVNGSIKISEVKGDIAVVSFAGALKIFKTTGLVNLQSTAGEQVGTRVMLTGSSSFKTTEGKIKMQIDNKSEELTFMLQSTNSFIQARGTSKKKKLKMGKGPIVVTGISTTGGQVYN